MSSTVEMIFLTLITLPFVVVLLVIALTAGGTGHGHQPKTNPGLPPPKMPKAPRYDPYSAYSPTNDKPRGPRPWGDDGPAGSQKPRKRYEP